MKDRIVVFVKKAGWRGAVLGIVLSVLLTPILSVIVNPVFVEAGVYGEPTIEKSVNRLDKEYPSDATVERFGNVTWKEEYDIYRISLSHESGPPIQNVIMEIRFPGCFQGAVKRGPEAEGEFTFDTPVEPLVEVSLPEKYHDQVDAEISACTAYLRVEEMHEDEIIRTPIVVSHQPEPCEMLVSYNPDRRFLVEYSWEADGKMVEEQEFGKVTNAENRYQNAKDVTNNSTLLWSERQYRAYLYGVESKNSTEAMNQCYRPPFTNQTERNSDLNDNSAEMRK
jgi:hypothetical protein